MRVTPDSLAARLDYQHRLTSQLSAFGEGWAGVANHGGQWGRDVGALLGLRYRW